MLFPSCVAVCDSNVVVVAVIVVSYSSHTAFAPVCVCARRPSVYESGQPFIIIIIIYSHIDRWCICVDRVGSNDSRTLSSTLGSRTHHFVTIPGKYTDNFAKSVDSRASEPAWLTGSVFVKARVNVPLGRPGIFCFQGRCVLLCLCGDTIITCNISGNNSHKPYVCAFGKRDGVYVCASACACARTRCQCNVAEHDYTQLAHTHTHT